MSSYLVQGLIQNTPEWLEFRSTRIGASDANIIMGVSKFMQPEELLQKKINPVLEEQKNTYITDKGHKLEDKMINYYNLSYSLNLEPVVMGLKDTPFIASLDGFDSEHEVIWEHKMVGAADFEKVVNGEMLPQYWPQVQMQLMVSKARYCMFACTDMKTESKTFLDIYPDLGYQERMTKELMEFYTKMENQEDYSAVDGRLTELLEIYKDLDRQSKLVKARLDHIKDEIFELVPKEKYKIAGASITFSESEEKIVPDFKAWSEAVNLDVPSDYMKVQKPRITKRITFSK